MRSFDTGTVHIIGAGLAGLAAAVRLSDSGRAIIVHEATNQPGGRCRSYYDQQSGMVIDNGSHLVLSGNHAVLDYARTVGGAATLNELKPEFPFVDLASKARWVLRFNEGMVPWWVFNKSARVPDTKPADYLRLARLLWASEDKPLRDVIDCEGVLYERLLEPLFLAALNIKPKDGSVKLASRLVRETLALGGQACHPVIAREGIGKAFVEPALTWLGARGVTVALQHALHALEFDGARVSALEFADGTVPLGSADRVILAVPAYAAQNFIAGLTAPSSFRGIVNAHFRIDPPKDAPAMIGLINAMSEWIFAFEDRVAVTISDGGEWFDTPREKLAADIWREVAEVLNMPADLPADLPPWQIVRERRATFAATPEENGKRPGPATRWNNLYLAGDWTDTGLPATLESAVRSGNAAAELVHASGRVAA
ncbi:MAG TPA: hydroxysqualene dehydroxylase HpnE [Pseudolabrys sp.]|nr:hydroxysqualene dehydroxylase HpnE [Pseudolabrys sp.]